MEPRDETFTPGDTVRWVYGYMTTINGDGHFDVRVGDVGTITEPLILASGRAIPQIAWPDHVTPLFWPDRVERMPETKKAAHHPEGQ